MISQLKYKYPYCFEDIQRNLNLKRIKENIKFYYRAFRNSQLQKINPQLTPHQDQLRQLIKDGVLVIEDFLTSAQVEKIIDEFKQNTEIYSKNKEEVKFFYSNYVVEKVDEVVPSSKLFFESDYINSLVKAYLSEEVRSVNKCARLKFNIFEDHKDYTEEYHYDADTPIFRAFLYLSDVGPDEGPFTYLAGSNRGFFWKLKKEKEEYVSNYPLKNPVFGEIVWDHRTYLLPEVHKLCINWGFEQKVITGKKGTLILADTRGLHKASPVKKPNCHRLVLVNKLEVVDTADYSNLGKLTK